MALVVARSWVADGHSLESVRSHHGGDMSRVGRHVGGVVELLGTLLGGGSIVTDHFVAFVVHAV